MIKVVYPIIIRASVNTSANSIMVFHSPLVSSLESWKMCGDDADIPIVDSTYKNILNTSMLLF